MTKIGEHCSDPQWLGCEHPGGIGPKGRIVLSRQYPTKSRVLVYNAPRVLRNTECFLRRKCLVERGDCMSIQIIHHQNDFLRVRVCFIHQPLHLMCPVGGSSTREGMGFTPATQRFGEHKYGTRAFSDVFAVILLNMVVFSHGNWHYIFIQKLKRLLIHANNGTFFIKRTGIYL